MENETKKKRDYLLPISILIAAVLIVGALVYSNGIKNTKTEAQEARLGQVIPKPVVTDPQIGNSVVLGNPQAPVTIFIFSDYQCPFCAKFFEESEKLIRKNYVDTGKVKMVYKDLAFLGPESISAAQAADCAKDQGKFWQYHDALFEAENKDAQENSGNLNRDLFQKIASDLQMNVNDFLSCFDSLKYADEVQQNISNAKSILKEITTPTIFINNKMIQGAYPYNVFSQAIDQALNSSNK